MADSIILTIKSWKVSSETGRRHLLEIGPQFQSEDTYSYEEKYVDSEETFDITCGKNFTYVWADQAVRYSINDGTIMTGQLIILTNDSQGPVLRITGILNATKVTITLVS